MFTKCVLTWTLEVAKNKKCRSSLQEAFCYILCRFSAYFSEVLSTLLKLYLVHGVRIVNISNTLMRTPLYSVE